MLVCPEIVVMDLDGTLCGINSHAPRCRSNMRILQERGTKMVLATSRGFEETTVYKLGDYYQLSHLILEAGTILLARKEETYERVREWDSLIRKERQDLEKFRREFLREYPLIRVEYVASNSRQYILLEPESGQEFPVYWHEETVTIQENDLDLYGRIRATVTGIVTDEDLAVTLIDYPSVGNRVEIVGATKGDAMIFLARSLGISPRRVCAMGDAENDLEMLEKAGIPAAPHNASDSVKKLVRQRGGILATREATSGVAEVLAKFI